MREYVASCPSGTRVQWNSFEWQSTIPTDTSIDIKVQTKQNAADSYQPVGALTLGSITSTTAAGVWAHGTSTPDQVLRAASLKSLNYLLVSLQFNPNSTGDTAPSLTNWRQNYDCVDSE